MGREGEDSEGEDSQGKDSQERTPAAQTMRKSHTLDPKSSACRHEIVQNNAPVEIVACDAKHRAFASSLILKITAAPLILKMTAAPLRARNAYTQQIDSSDGYDSDSGPGCSHPYAAPKSPAEVQLRLLTAQKDDKKQP